MEPMADDEITQTDASTWECAVCGQAFDDEAERDVHERDQHGVGSGESPLTTQDNLEVDQANAEGPGTSSER